MVVECVVAVEMSNWEGGVRVNSWVSGGFLPVSVRGTKYEGLACGWDWYSTFCELAGVLPRDLRAAAANLPPLDSISVVPVILGTGKGTTINGLLSEDEDGNLWKLLTGGILESGWTGPQYPNASTDTCCFNHHHAGYFPPPSRFGRVCPQSEICVEDCGKGECLFNVLHDPTENKNVAKLYPEKVAEMLKRIDMIKQTAFLPIRCHCGDAPCDDGYGGVACSVTNDTEARPGASVSGAGYADPAACERAISHNEGFWGPFVFP